jgi:hypothetical protein
MLQLYNLLFIIIIIIIIIIMVMISELIYMQ